jgi:branched-chain amino acid transport system substrate-binding protein
MRVSGGRRHWWVRGIGLLCVAALVAVACGDGEAPEGAQQPRGGTPATGEPIRVGFLVDQTGALAAYGYAHQKVGEAAVEVINSQGGVDGRPIELVIEDTESDPAVAAPKARRLVESENVDFLLGSNTSAVVLAIAPIAQELETVYFPTAGGALLTEPGKGNRYVFDFNTNVKQEVRGAVNFITSNLDATNWMTSVVDYSWGWDNELSFAREAQAAGLNVVGDVRVPLGEANWLAHLQGEVPEEAQGVYFANFGTDFLSFMEGLSTLAPDIQKIGANYVLSGQDLGTIPEAEGMYVMSGYPQFSSAINSEYDAEYREIIGMDETGLEDGTGEPLVPSYQWSTWEALWAIKEIGEEIGWEDKSDTCEFIGTLEGYQFEEGLAHPEGPKSFRPEDHLSLKGAWVEQLVGGQLEVAARIESEAMAYEPVVNYPEEQPLGC